MDVEVFPYTTLWDTTGGVDATAIPERQTESLRILLHPAITTKEISVLSSVANTYPRVRVVLDIHSSVAWAHLCHFTSLHGVQVYGIDVDSIARLGDMFTNECGRPRHGRDQWHRCHLKNALLNLIAFYAVTARCETSNPIRELCGSSVQSTAHAAFVLSGDWR